MGKLFLSRSQHPDLILRQTGESTKLPPPRAIADGAVDLSNGPFPGLTRADDALSSAMVRQLAFVSVLMAFASSCSTTPVGSWPGGALLPAENPLFVATMDRDFLWNQIVDAVDDDFRVEREQRMEVLGGVVTEGTIETFPTTGSTIFEPSRSDSTWGFQRQYATLQSIRRRASVRVTPSPGGYLVALVVTTELEDLGRPEQAMAGTVLLDDADSVASGEERRMTGAATLGWIPMGRDTSLEQKILADIRQRLGQVGPAGPPLQGLP